MFCAAARDSLGHLLVHVARPLVADGAAVLSSQRQTEDSIS